MGKRKSIKNIPFNSETNYSTQSVYEKKYNRMVLTVKMDSFKYIYNGSNLKIYTQKKDVYIVKKLRFKCRNSRCPARLNVTYVNGEPRYYRKYSIHNKACYALVKCVNNANAEAVKKITTEFETKIKRMTN